MDNYLEEAEIKEFSAEQVAALERARAKGDISYEEVSEAVDRSLECISNAGFYVERYPAAEQNGYPMVDYFFEGPETGNPVADACIRVHSQALEDLYQLQPTSIAAQNAHWAELAPQLEDCLAEHGVEISFEGLTGDEFGAAIHDAVNDQLDTNTDGPAPALECFAILTQ